MTNEEITRIALANGFALKVQDGGEKALNPYVFDFARALLSAAPSTEQPLRDALDGWAQALISTVNPNEDLVTPVARLEVDTTPPDQCGPWRLRYGDISAIAKSANELADYLDRGYMLIGPVSDHFSQPDEMVTPTPPEVEPVLWWCNRASFGRTGHYIDNQKDADYWVSQGFKVIPFGPINQSPPSPKAVEIRELQSELAVAKSLVRFHEKMRKSDKAEYDAEGNPLNLMAAAEKAIKALQAAHYGGESPNPKYLEAATSLRKFLGDEP